MSNYIAKETSDLFDPATGKWVGVIDKNGQEHVINPGDALPTLASGDGNVTAAALPALVGTPGQIVRLSDGDDKGALLVWAIPSGSSSYAWCWWLWPQSSYF